LSFRERPNQCVSDSQPPNPYISHCIGLIGFGEDFINNSDAWSKDIASRNRREWKKENEKKDY